MSHWKKSFTDKVRCKTLNYLWFSTDIDIYLNLILIKYYIQWNFYWIFIKTLKFLLKILFKLNLEWGIIKSKIVLKKERKMDLYIHLWGFAGIYWLRWCLTFVTHICLSTEIHSDFGIDANLSFKWVITGRILYNLSCPGSVRSETFI